MHPASRSLALLLAAAFVISATACGGDELVLPSNTSAAKITSAGGDGQSALVGGQLEQPAVVLVVDGQNRPVEGQAVTFSLPGGGQAAPASALTDARGYASTRWTLGNSAGGQTLRAQVTGDNLLFVMLNATAIPGSGASFVVADGDEQSGPVGSALADSLVVKVTDGFGNPVAGVTVDWAVEGGGSISPASTVTSADGHSSAERVLGTSSGAQSATATAGALATSPVTFHHTARAASPTLLQRISGDAQSAPAGFAVSDSLLVRLVDANGNGVGNKPVTWIVATGGGSVTPVNSATSPQGYATTRWTLGPNAGPNLLNAVYSGVPSIPFSATATADRPARMVRLSGDAQTAAVGSALAQPLAVKVTDANGNPVADVPVTWTAASGGTVSAPITATDADGIARVTRIVGAAPGQYTTTAAVAGLEGSPVTFTATATAGAAVRLVLTQQPASSAQSGIALNQQPVVRLEDAFGNPAAQSGIAVTVRLVGTAELGGTTTRNTTSAGTVTFSGLSLTGAVGNYRLAFGAAGLDGAESGPITLAAGAAARLSLAQQPAGSAQSGVALSPQPVVQVTDAVGNAVALGGRTIAASINDGEAASLSGGLKATNGQGQAAFASLTLSGTSGARTLLFSAVGLVSVESGSVTLGAGGAANLVKTAGDGQSVQAGTAVSVAPSVRLTDGTGNPIIGASVSFTVASGGGSVTGTPTTTDADGVATVGSWTLGASAGTGNNALTASSSGVTAVTFTASATAGPASRLALVTPPPATAQSGAVLTSAPQVQLRDAAGNAVAQAGVTVQVTVASGSGTASLDHASATTNGTGIATFTSLALSGPVGGYTLGFTAGSLSGVVSGTITLSAGSAAELRFIAEPGNTPAGQTITPAVKVGLFDAAGNLATGTSGSVTVALGVNPSGTATLSGTTAVPVASGVATFADLAVDLSDTGYVLAASTGTLPVASSSSFNVTP